MVDGEPAVAGDEHHALPHGLVVERVRLGGNRGLGLGKLSADRPREWILIAVTRSSGKVRLTPTARSTNSAAPAGRPHAFDVDDAGTRRAIAATFSLTPAGAVSVNVSMVRRPRRASRRCR
jgi:hypothetical protein